MRPAALALLFALGLAPSPAQGTEPPAPHTRVTFLGPARAISHSSSASRDTMALGVVFLPRGILSGGGDFALVGVTTPCWSLRLGFQGMLELEGQHRTERVLPFPSSAIDLLRGLYGASLAVSPDRLATTWLGRGGALEATLSVRHESEHRTASNDGDAPPDVSDFPHVGNFVMPDLAARVAWGDLVVEARAQAKLFLPGGGWSVGPGGDLGVRFRRWPRLHPFASVFAEWLAGRDVRYRGCRDCAMPDQYALRALAGVVVPSAHGELFLYLVGDVGNRKGLAVFQEEASLGAGVRVAFF